MLAMRMTKSLGDVCSEIFYKSELICGLNTTVDDPTCSVPALIHDIIREEFADLSQDSASSTYQFFSSGDYSTQL